MLSKTSLATLVVATLSPLAQAAGSAIIQNQCKENVYLWTVSNIAGAMQTIKPGDKYVEAFEINPDGGGISMKMSMQPNLSGSITQYEYTLDGKLWYDVSNINGNPFMESGLTLIPSDSSCRSVVCPAGVELCTAAYNQPDDNEATAACELGADTTLVLCSGQHGSDPVASASDVASATKANNVLVAAQTSAPAAAAITAPAVSKAAPVGNVHTTFVTQVITVVAGDVAPPEATQNPSKRDQVFKRAAHRHHFHRHAGDSN